MNRSVQVLGDSTSMQGAALLMAMLTVVLIASLASYGLWQQQRTLAVEKAERDAQQAHWLLNGAQDWARLVLREDARSSQTDHLAEPWATPLREARLSRFLAASASGVVHAPEGVAEEAFLSGRIQDLQGRLNVTNLVNGGRLNPEALKAFARLYEVLGLPEQELLTWTQALRAASESSEKPNQPWMPQRVTQLGWLGIPVMSLKRLNPHITVLPVSTTVNLNTASPEVLFASVDGLSVATAQQWVQARSDQPFDNLEAIRQRMGPSAQSVNETRHSVQSRYFEVLGQLTLRDVQMTQRAVVQRDGLEIKTLWREYTPHELDPHCPHPSDLRC